MNVANKLIGLGCMVAMACWGLGCGKGAETAGGGRTLRAAVCPTSPPNCYQEGKEYAGIDLDLFRLYCESRGHRYEITAYDWSGMLGAVVSGRADVAFSGISITEKRKESMDFSDAYMVNVLVIASLAGGGVEMATTADWKKYRLGFVRGMYFGDLVKTTYADAYAYADLRQYPSYNELLADLGNGNVDGAFMDSLVMADQKEKAIYALETAFTLAEKDEFGFAFAKGSPLRDDFNQFLLERAEEARAIVAARVK